jgi:hypothetical protein
VINQSYVQLATAAASRYGLPTGLVNGVLAVESDGNPNAVSDAGAMGLMQLMPGTAQSLGVTDPFDPAQSVQGGAKYLSHLLAQFPTSWEHVLVAYRNGAGYVHDHLDPSSWSEGARSYVRKVFSRWVPGSVPSFDKVQTAPRQQAAPFANVTEYTMPAMIVPVGKKPASGLAMGAVIVAVGAATVGLIALALRR